MSSAPYHSPTCVTAGVFMIQNDLIWGTLSSIRRDTAISRRSAWPVGPGRWSMAVRSGCHDRGMKASNPFVSSCSSRSFMR